MIAGKTLLVHANLFFSNYYKKNDKTICKYFQDKYGNPWHRWNKKLSFPGNEI